MKRVNESNVHRLEMLNEGVITTADATLKGIFVFVLRCGCVFVFRWELDCYKLFFLCQFCVCSCG